MFQSIETFVRIYINRMIQNGFTDNDTSSSIIKIIEKSDDQKIDLAIDNVNDQTIAAISVSGGIIVLTVILIGSVRCWYMKKKTATNTSVLNSRSEEKSINKYSQLLINENQMTIGQIENTNSK